MSRPFDEGLPGPSGPRRLPWLLVGLSGIALLSVAQAAQGSRSRQAQKQITHKTRSEGGQYHHLKDWSGEVWAMTHGGMVDYLKKVHHHNFDWFSDLAHRSESKEAYEADAVNLIAKALPRSTVADRSKILKLVRAQDIWILEKRVQAAIDRAIEVAEKYATASNGPIKMSAAPELREAVMLCLQEYQALALAEDELIRRAERIMLRKE